MIKLVEVKPLGGYKIWVRYADGAEGEVHLCRDAIYLQLTGKTPEEVFPKLAN